MKKVIKMLLFYPMFWLRGLLMTVSKLLGYLLLFGGFVVCIGVFASDVDQVGGAVVAGIGFAMSFLLFLFRQFYDNLLLKLNPTDHDLTLRQ